MILISFKAPTKNSPEKVRDRVRTFQAKSGKPPGLPSPNPDLPFLAFWAFLAFSVARNFLVFLSVFPFFPWDFVWARAANGGSDPSWLNLAFLGRPNFQSRGPQFSVQRSPNTYKGFRDLWTENRGAPKTPNATTTDLTPHLRPSEFSEMLLLICP